MGLNGFVGNLLNSDEYCNTFEDEEVPYQGSRVPANPFIGGGVSFRGGTMSPTWVGGKPPELAQKAWLGLTAVGVLELVRILLTTAGAMLSTAARGS